MNSRTPSQSTVLDIFKFIFWHSKETLLSALASGLLIAACASDPGDTTGSTASGIRPPGEGGVSADTCSQPASPEDAISDFKDGFGYVQQIPGVRGGGFYVYNDGTGTQTPAPGGSGAPACTPEAHCGNSYVLCTKGSGFTTWGAGVATDIGPTDSSSGAKKPFDASAYSGVAFSIKSNSGTPTVSVHFGDVNSTPEGGKCDTKDASGPKACYNDYAYPVELVPGWKSVKIAFTDLKQDAGWGLITSGFDKTTLYAIKLQFGKGVDFDFCIDGLIFTR